jgi:hypothetical protein
MGLVIMRKQKVIWSIVILAGITSGLYLGNEIFGEKQSSAEILNAPSDLGVTDAIRQTFGLGDEFPNIEIQMQSGEKLQIQDILKGKRSGLIIAQLGCPPCEEYFGQWRNTVLPKVRNNTQQLVLISNDPKTNRKDLPKYLNTSTVLFMDMVSFEEKFNSHTYPTAFAIDESGVVVGQQYGKQRGINHEIVRFLTTHDI